MLGRKREKSVENEQKHEANKVMEMEDEEQTRGNKREEGKLEKGDEEEMNMER
jgi:hypothetical protein